MYNFGLSADQRALKAALRRFFDAECSSAHVRHVIENEIGFAADQWHGLAELGVFGLAADEGDGGSGLGYFDLVVLLEELGRTALPAPTLETLVAVQLITALGSAEQRQTLLAPIIAGTSVASLAIDDIDCYWRPDDVTATATAIGNGRYRLAGNKPWVAYGNSADLVLAAVQVEARGTVLVSLNRERMAGHLRTQDGIDDSYRLAELTLDGVEIDDADLLGSADPDAVALRRAWDLGAVLAAAELLGCLERSLELIVDYSKVREQFGKPIGSFQALKHRCADLLIDLEAARGSVYYAAQALQTGTTDAALAVSSAKAYASDAAVRCAEKALQSFGAIGFTWEYDIHFYLKRAKRLEMTFGNAAHHRELVARHL